LPARAADGAGLAEALAGVLFFILFAARLAGFFARRADLAAAFFAGRRVLAARTVFFAFFFAAAFRAGFLAAFFFLATLGPP
jgi:hypothetical protein